MRNTTCISVFALVLAACGPTVRLTFDPCDGVDNDADGTVDEGRGEEVGCGRYELCIDGMCALGCGNLRCETTESCESCPGDCGACPFCGDGRCQTATGESCESCAGDCGVCPFCGDGDCQSAIGEDCGTCSDDCGACPRCGDGSCNGDETCTTCHRDCGPCPGECGPCGPGPDFDCPGATNCYVNQCTGTLYCERPGVSVCREFAGALCGTVPVYGRCTDDSQCGRPLTCVARGEIGHCTHTESGDIRTTCDNAACPYPASAPAGLEAHAPCQGNPSRDLESYMCVLACPDGSCPYGMDCVDDPGFPSVGRVCE
ncbi:MAG: hypothetical protein J0L92_34930 [Deltaproteobacteria bacterium]|nr:hypothetical protein [Deltaproteobacteria bacterium]